MAFRSRFLHHAVSRLVVVNALKVSIVVGSVLALINHGEAVINLTVSFSTAIKILLSYAVPYCVSTYSAVKAIEDSETN